MSGIAVSKMDAAKRQLDCAIELWFHDKDPVSVHTLACASYQILYDIIKKKKGKDLIFDSDVIKDEYREKFATFLRKPGNFFKHADKDPEGIIEYAPIASLLFLTMSCVTLIELGERRSDYQIAISVWIGIHKPEWMSRNFTELMAQRMTVEQLSRVRNMKKNEFLQEIIYMISRLRAQGQAPIH